VAGKSYSDLLHESVLVRLRMCVYILYFIADIPWPGKITA
jgi:hypothetical protein